VRPSPKNFEGPTAGKFFGFAFPAGVIILAMCKDSAAGKFGPNFYAAARRVFNFGVKIVLKLKH
jgi:hypothetical protein